MFNCSALTSSLVFVSVLVRIVHCHARQARAGPVTIKKELDNKGTSLKLRKTAGIIGRNVDPAAVCNCVLDPAPGATPLAYPRQI